MKVFVYGSLLSGLGNHAILARAVARGGARFVGRATTPASYTMRSLGAFPACYRDGATSIVGEVYDVDVECAAELDRLEGHPRFYTRIRVRLTGGARAWMYLILNDDRGRRGDRVDSGDWRQWVGGSDPDPDPEIEEEFDDLDDDDLDDVCEHGIDRDAHVCAICEAEEENARIVAMARAEARRRKVLVFAFGSNMDREQMRRRCRSTRFAGVARLRGHRLAFAGFSTGWGGAVATVRREHGHDCVGLLYEITLDDLHKLDRCEGHPWAYRRVDMSVHSARGIVRAFLYRLDRPLGTPSIEYASTIAKAHTRHGLDPKRVADAILFSQDPKWDRQNEIEVRRVRRAQNGSNGTHSSGSRRVFDRSEPAALDDDGFALDDDGDLEEWPEDFFDQRELVSVGRNPHTDRDGGTQ